MKIKYLLFTLLFSLMVFIPQSHAMQLLFKRIIFEGPKRADYITFINESNQPKTYRISWREMTMGEGKGLRKKTPNEIAQMQYKASDMIRYSPRRVTVQPKEAQEIRLMLRRPGDLPDGEYRSHLIIQEESTQNKTQRGTGGATARSEFNPGMSLPIFVRKGDLISRVNITSATAQNQGDSVIINFSMHREGTKSVYMNIDFICNPRTNPYVLGSNSGLAIYTEITDRNFRNKIKRDSTQATCSELGIKATEAVERGDPEGQILATRLVSVN